MGKLRDKWAERRAKRQMKRDVGTWIKKEGGYEAIKAIMDEAEKRKVQEKAKKMTANKGGRISKSSGGSVASRLSKAGPVAKPN